MYRCNNGVFYSLFPPFTRGNRCSPGKSMGFLRQNSKLDLNFRPVSDIIGNVKCRCDGMVDVTDSKSVGGDTVWVRVPPPAPGPEPSLVERLRSFSFPRLQTMAGCGIVRGQAGTAGRSGFIPPRPRSVLSGIASRSGSASNKGEVHAPC